MNLILIYINIEKGKDISIKDMDESDGLIEQKIERGGDVISKNINNNESKAFKEDLKPDAPNYNSNANQVGLEKKKENDIESNKLIGEEEITSDEKNEHKKFVYFDKPDQMNNKNSESILDKFVENNLIDFRCVKVKDEIIWELDTPNGRAEIVRSEMEYIEETCDKFYNEKDKHKKFICCQENKMNSNEEDLVDFGCVAKEAINVLGALSVVVLERDKIVKCLLEVLSDEESDEFDCSVDLSKWHWHMNFRNLDNRIVRWC
ncbi:21133_t:CDS:2 [Dentiscutata erythropus]|uniref:21133_t:CDS:1 n=1 Tax=Dentiscutata erythropus TaxID=1348616 RepID=A0A9N9HU78_9GLOM|nr:21133_t:CDS:2 [Dentiscutata erythropus]